MKNKVITTIISLILILTIASQFIALLPIANAESAPTKKTFAFIGATPNPVGIGQETLIHLGITHQTARADIGWEDLTVTVIKPDNTTETLGPFKTDSTGGTGTVYVPTMVGTYYFQTHFPEQTNQLAVTLAGILTPAGTIMQASSSEELPLIVQEDPLFHYPGVPLPNEYWTRPIDAQFWGWNSIAGNWVGVDEAYGLIAPIAHNNGNAPETAHILWAKQLQTGGLAGGIDFGPQSYDCGDAYEGLFGAPVIIAGVLYYNQFKADGALRVEQNVVAVDLHTGEELWIKQLVGPDGIGRRLSFGQVFYFSSFNYHAVFSYLWTVDGTTWHAFDPFTGRWVYSMTNVPAGKNLYGPKGEIYRYTVNIANGWMTLWNSSKAVQPQTTGGSGDGSWVRGQMGTTINATRGIEWNKTLPEGLTGSLSETYFSNRIYFQERMVGTAKTSTDINIWSVNLKPGQEGQLLFKTTWKLPVENITLVLGQTISIEDDVFTIYSPELRQHWALA